MNKAKGFISIVLSLMIAVIFLAGAWIYSKGKKNPLIAEENPPAQNKSTERNFSNSGTDPAFKNETVLIADWNGLGRKMIEAGVIDEKKFEEVYFQKGGLSDSDRELLSRMKNGKLKITSENTGLVLNMLWAFGLSNKNDVLEKGEMTNPRYGGDASRFASAGGWTLAGGDAMDHYDKHVFVKLNSDQEIIVERISKNIYRPCCDNPAHFPDCNHGMAMLGLIELMASQGYSESQIYNVALKVNSFWFPDNYATIASYLKQTGKKASAKEILGAEYSSISGYQNILAQTAPVKVKNAGGCSI